MRARPAPPLPIFQSTSVNAAGVGLFLLRTRPRRFFARARQSRVLSRLMPESVDDLLREAVAHHQAGRLAEARTLYEEVLRLDEANPNALNLLGMVHHAQECNEHAAELIARAIEAAPAVAGFNNNLGTVRLAQR